MEKQKVIDEIVSKTADGYLERLSLAGWWHSIELGGGLVTDGVVKLEDLKTNYGRFQLPEDLDGKRVMDIGCWDGFYAFEAESHGAKVVAIDCFRPETFFMAREARKSDVKFIEMNVYELSRDTLGAFDIVIFQGVLYHLQHPLLGLQRVCEVTTDTALIGSHIVDNLIETDAPIMRFYPMDELGGQYDNWWGPSSRCLEDLVKAAGFVEVEALYNDSIWALLKAHRKWNHPKLSPTPNLAIREIVNTVRLDRHYERRGRFALLSVWVEGLPLGINRERVRAEVGEFGVRPVYIEPPIDFLRHTVPRINKLSPPQINLDLSVKAAAEKYSQVIIPIPPGLPIGNTTVKIYCDDQWSESVEIFLSDNSYW